MGHSGGSLEDQNVERNCEGLVHEVSEGNKDSLYGNWATGHVCDILTKNLPEVCPCSKNLSEAELKD